jgi:hypothetical protein
VHEGKTWEDDLSPYHLDATPHLPSFRFLADMVDPFLQKLFETGVDEMSWDDMDELQDCDFPWPDVAEAQAFRLKVRGLC